MGKIVEVTEKADTGMLRILAIKDRVYRITLSNPYNAFKDLDSISYRVRKWLHGVKKDRQEYPLGNEFVIYGKGEPKRTIYISRA